MSFRIGQSALQRPNMILPCSPLSAASHQASLDGILPLWSFAPRASGFGKFACGAPPSCSVPAFPSRRSFGNWVFRTKVSSAGSSGNITAVLPWSLCGCIACALIDISWRSLPSLPGKLLKPSFAADSQGIWAALPLFGCNIKIRPPAFRRAQAPGTQRGAPSRFNCSTVALKPASTSPESRWTLVESF